MFNNISLLPRRPGVPELRADHRGCLSQRGGASEVSCLRRSNGGHIRVEVQQQRRRFQRQPGQVQRVEFNLQRPHVHAAQ